jgi:hypothetical protein
LKLGTGKRGGLDAEEPGAGVALGFDPLGEEPEGDFVGGDLREAGDDFVGGEEDDGTRGGAEFDGVEEDDVIVTGKGGGGDGAFGVWARDDDVEEAGLVEVLGEEDTGLVVGVIGVADAEPEDSTVEAGVEMGAEILH